MVHIFRLDHPGHGDQVSFTHTGVLCILFYEHRAIRFCIPYSGKTLRHKG